MPKDFMAEEDVQESLDSQSRGDGRTLTIPEGKTPVYFLSGSYADGYIHWVSLPDGSRVRVVDPDGLEGRGWTPDTNPITKYCQTLYKEAKAAEDAGQEKKAKALRARAGQMKPRYEARFLVAVGELVRVKKKDGSKGFEPDFEGAKVGILALTRKQFDDFVALRKSERYPFIKSPQNLLDRPIILDKRKRDDAMFATIEFIPSRHPMDPPDVEYDADDFDLDSDYEADEEQVAKLAKLLRGAAKDDDDDEVELDTADDDDDLDDDFLDDEDAEEEEDDEDEDTDDDFLDEDSPSKKKPAKAKSSARSKKK